MGEWPVQQSEDVGLTLYEYIGQGGEGIDHCMSSPRRAATSSRTGSSCDGQTGSLLSSVSPPANLINTTSPALLTTLINITVCYSLSRGLHSEEFVPHKWSGGKVELYSRGGGKLSVFSFFALLFTPNLCDRTQLLPPQESHYFTL